MNTEAAAIWARMLRHIEPRLAGPAFRTWIEPCRPGEITQRRLQVLVPDDLFVYWLTDRYVGLFTAAHAAIWGQPPDKISFDAED